MAIPSSAPLPSLSGETAASFLRCSVADDGICPKANVVPLQGLTVRNTTVRSRSGAIKFGSNTGPGTTLLLHYLNCPYNLALD